MYAIHLNTLGIRIVLWINSENVECPLTIFVTGFSLLINNLLV